MTAAAQKKENEILAQKVNGRLHAAFMHDRKLYDLYVDTKPELARWASIYLGKVTKLDNKLNGAFVSLGGSQLGFLPAKHVIKNSKSYRDAPISKLLEPGQMIYVQIKSEGKLKTALENQKNPRLSMKIYVPGRALYYNPFGSYGISLEDHDHSDEFKKFCEELKKFGGWHFHGNSQGATLENIKAEAKELIISWRAIKASVEKSGDKPRLLRMGPNAIQRLIMDYPQVHFTHLEIAEDCNPGSIKPWLTAHSPYLLENLHIAQAHKVDLFEIRDVYSGLDQAQSSLLNLPSGGSIIIDYTHAMTIIDVNQGECSDIIKTNKEAAHEAARQIRIRNMSGAILIDFINLHKRSERYELIRALQSYIGRDPANAAVHGFTRLGIIEITRTRRTATLEEKSRN